MSVRSYVYVITYEIWCAINSSLTRNPSHKWTHDNGYCFLYHNLRFYHGKKKKKKELVSSTYAVYVINNNIIRKIRQTSFTNYNNGPVKETTCARVCKCACVCRARACRRVWSSRRVVKNARASHDTGGLRCMLWEIYQKLNEIRNRGSCILYDV